MRFWLLAFFLIPIIEMYLLIRVGGYIGAWPTIVLVMLTAVVGVMLLRIQGFTTLTRGMARLQSGELPAREMVEGLLLAVSGALLLTPGFATDLFGFAMLIPPLRGAAARWLLSRAVVDVRPGAHPRRRGPTIIEGEYHAHNDEDDEPPRRLR
ncbi:MAG: FxsA family protein [Pseudomonadota bacterium]